MARCNSLYFEGEGIVKTMFVDSDSDLNTRQLRSWNVLSRADTSRLLYSIECIQQQVDAYDEELQNLLDRVRVLEQQKDYAVKSLRRKRSLLAPIRRLPIELLEEIFALYLHSYGKDVMK
ncbi:hypothetical protein D9758_005732 [Tetrapyrgos nigripes]|uniref:DED domain-containing protein n=1 Tax=Tetrapyrgos nigripes TaxID=182062 RepID=A0A8H5GJU5_9AGAR|nr:hypothetical protein D9758_005732 [Tetrapyrgos nigripes]